MKKIIDFLPFNSKEIKMKKVMLFILLVISYTIFTTDVKAAVSCFPPNSPICGGGEEAFNIVIEGCANDGALCGSCARKTAGYCKCNGDGVVIPDCRGPLSDGECARTCDTSNGFYCDMNSVDGGNCEDLNVGNCKLNADNWNDCVNDVGCYFDNSKCLACPPPGDRLCSDYKSYESCNFDVCGFGTQGPDSYLCRLEGINDCGCSWDSSTNQCEFGFMKFNGVDETFCNLEQIFLEPECNPDTNKRTLQTTELCEGSLNKSLNTREIDCGRAVSPLSFFSLFSLVSSLIVIALYYSLRNRQDL